MEEKNKVQKIIKKINDKWLKLHLTARILLPLIFIVSIAMMIGGYSAIPRTYTQEELIKVSNPSIEERNIPFVQSNYSSVLNGNTLITDDFVNQYIEDTRISNSVLKLISDLTNETNPATSTGRIGITTLFGKSLELEKARFVDDVLPASFIVVNTIEEGFTSKLEKSKVNEVKYVYVYYGESNEGYLYKAGDVNIDTTKTISQQINDNLKPLTGISESQYPTIKNILDDYNAKYINDDTKNATSTDLKASTSIDSTQYNSALQSVVTKTESEKERISESFSTSVGIGVSGTAIFLIITIYGIWSFRVIKKKLEEISS